MATQGPGTEEVPFAANAVRLSVREWLAVLVVVAAVFGLTPPLWQRAETFEPGTDYRIPEELSRDYWLFERYARRMAAQDKTLVVGDSVVWGQPVPRGQTLSAHLNRLSGGEGFANLGVNGMHPASLAGLLDYYGRPIAGRRVVLHWNLLWTCSKRRDLQDPKEARFNHPGLVPQFFPRIPCYRATASERIGAIVERTWPFAAWANHLRVVYFGEMGIPHWTLKHPYANPLRPITFVVPPARPREVERDNRPWVERTRGRHDFPWVDLATSLQWRFLCDALATLQRRGNRVFVLLGPFNEHLLTPASRARYRERKQAAVRWLRDHAVAHFAPEPLPSRLYVDASHPLPEGYAALAEQLLAHQRFAAFKGDRYLFPERPAGCFAEKVPVPFSAHIGP